MLTDILGLQPRRAVEGQQHREYSIVDEGGHREKLDGTAGSWVVWGEKGRSWKTRTWMWMTVVKEAAQECHIHTTQPFIDHSVVCMMSRFSGHVWDFAWVPRCFLLRSIPSRTLGRNVCQGIPCVRGFQWLCTLLSLLSPQGVGLWNSAHVLWSHDRSIGGMHGRCHVFSMLVIDRGDKWAER